MHPAGSDQVSGATVARLRAAGCVFAEDEAALLHQAATGAELEQMITQRVAGLPLEQILGWAEFDGLRIRLDPGVFVPRRRTLVLVQEVVRMIEPGPAPVVVDLCCGSGAIGAAIATRVPTATVYAADLDPAAVHCARRNLPSDRVFAGDLFDALPVRLRGHIDVLVVNAPYVPTAAIATMPPEARDHEPRVALDGGADGVDLHRRVAGQARPWLAPAGAVIVETSRRQLLLTETAFVTAGFTTQSAYDEECDGTAVCARPA